MRSPPPTPRWLELIDRLTTDPSAARTAALTAILLAAGVPYGRWLAFAVGGWTLVTAVGIAGPLVAVWLG